MLVIKNPPANAGDIRDTGPIAGSGRSPRGGHGNTPVFLPEESHGQRGLEGYSLWGLIEFNKAEQPIPTHMILLWKRK